jgi:hypothetical protein
MVVRKTKAVDEAVPRAPRAHARSPLRRSYEHFLDLPVPLVLAAMWLAGAALLGSVGTALWLTVRALVRMAMGAA